MDAPVRGVGGDVGPGLQRGHFTHPSQPPALRGGDCGWYSNLDVARGESLVRFDHFWAKAKLISGRLITGYAPNQCAPQFSLVVPNPIIATGVTASSEVPQSS
jgi:hypothetical protein